MSKRTSVVSIAALCVFLILWAATPLHTFNELAGTRHPLASVGFLALIAACLYLAWRRFGDPSAALLGVGALAVGVVAIGLSIGFEERTHGVVADYCHYGVVSDAQYKGCLDHVTKDDVNRLNTNAARFGRGETDACLPDAGPYWVGVARWRAQEPVDSPGP